LAFRANLTVFFKFRAKCAGRVADEQRGVGLLEHFCQIGAGFKKTRRDLPFFSAQDARQCLVLRNFGPARSASLVDRFFETMSRLRTCFFDAMAISGRITRSSMRCIQSPG